MPFPTAQTTHSKPGGQFKGWSFSKLKNFASCPRKHLEVDIEKRWSDNDTGNEALEIGNAIHKAMDNRLVKGEPIPSHLQVYVAGNMEEWCKRVLRGHATAKDFEKATNGTLKVENNLAITDKYEPCGWFDRQVSPWCRAKLDVRVKLGQVAVLYDWKTGKVSKYENDQLMISAAMEFAHSPEVMAIRTMYVWLKDDATTTLDIKREHLPEIWARLLPGINAYRKAVVEMKFPEKPSGLCGYCPVRTCEHNPNK